MGMKSRVMVLGILAIIGIAMVFSYTALASEAKEPELLIFRSDEETGTMTMVDKMTMGDKEEIVVITKEKGFIEEGQTIEESNITIVKQAELTEEEEAKALEIALNDPRVQEIIEGKEYEITGVGAITEIPTGRVAGATVAILIPEEAVYSLMIDLEKEEVIDIMPFQLKKVGAEIPEE